jgi:ribonucleoside-diphosphate reductase alpha chain
MTLYNGIQIDYSKDQLLTEFGMTLAKEKYLKGKEKSPQEAFARTAVSFCGGDMELAQRIYNYASNLWIGFASPVLSNSTYEGETTKSLPISCFAGFVPDSIDGLLEHKVEIAKLTIAGGGTAGGWSNVRSISNKAPGPIPFIKVMDSIMDAYQQGEVRRGAYAAYLDVSHPDIIEFLKLRVPTGDASRKCNSIGFHNAVNITDEFMEAVVNNTTFNLVDPKSKEVKEVVNARDLWEEILTTRNRTGEPYLHFSDTSNRALPDFQKALGLRVSHSNLCSEIMLPTNEERTFVCCLSSLNLEYYDSWYNTSIVEDMVTFLDNVMSVFIEKCPDDLSKARFSAYKERALGLGAMGYHSYLQKNNLPFGSKESKKINLEMFSIIKTRALKQTYHLGSLRGEPDDCKGTGRRNSHLLAIAPTANNATIVGTSASIEAENGNAYVQQTRIGNFLVKNKFLEPQLEKLGMNNAETWKSIIVNEGSIQHLDVPDDIKEVFKTAFEIDQLDVVEQAGDRQRFICQGQSTNLFFKKGTTKAYFNKVHIEAWRQGCKSLYYVRSKTDKAKSASVKQERFALISNERPDEDCEACQ